MQHRNQQILKKLICCDERNTYIYRFRCCYEFICKHIAEFIHSFYFPSLWIPSSNLCIFIPRWGKRKRTTISYSFGLLSSRLYNSFLLLFELVIYFNKIPDIFFSVFLSKGISIWILNIRRITLTDLLRHRLY